MGWGELVRSKIALLSLTGVVHKRCYILKEGKIPKADLNRMHVLMKIKPLVNQSQEKKQDWNASQF